MKTAKKNFTTGGWAMKPAEVAKFVPVTEANRKSAIVYGRILYVIEQNGRVYTYRGCFSVDPFFSKGRYNYPILPWLQTSQSHQSVYFDADADYDSWLLTNKALIDTFINEKKLYLKPTDKLLTYTKES